MRSSTEVGRLAAAAAVAALLAGSLAGCGGPANASEGSPVRVMTWAPEDGAVGSQAGVTALAEVISQQVNANGGLQGRTLQVLTCDEHNSLNGAVACADQAVAEHVDAVVGSYSQFGEAFMPVLEAGGVPYLGGFGLSSQEFSSPYSYPVNGGYQSLLAGNGEQLAESGCRRVAVVRPQTTAGETMLAFLEVGLASKHITAVDIPAQPGRTDYATEATTAIGADLPHSCVTTALDPASTATFFDNYRRESPRNTQLSSVIGSVQQSLVDSTGGASGPLKNVLATGWYPPDSSKVWDGLHATIKKYAFTDNRINAADPGEQTTWIAYEVLQQAVARIQGPIDTQSIRNVLNQGGPITTGGQTPPLSWRMSDMLPLVSAPRLVNTQVSFQQVESGELTEPRSGAVDVRSLLIRSSGN